MQMQLRKMMISVALLAVFVMCVGAQPPQAQGIERTRTFAAQKCQYTLPGPDWKWLDRSATNSLFLAQNRKGFVVFLTATRMPPEARLDSAFAENFERDFYQRTQYSKRGGRFVAFQGLPYYQTEAKCPDGRTMIVRTTIVNGLRYSLGITGGREPVEQDPEVEAVLGSFAFTEPPLLLAETAVGGSGHSTEYYVAWGLFGIFLLFAACCFLKRPAQKRKGASYPEYDYDLDDRPRLPSASPWPLQAGSVGFRTARSIPRSTHGTDVPSLESQDVEPVSGPPAGLSSKCTGKCRECGYRPVAFGAPECPRCGTDNPNPGVVSRFTGRAGLGGALIGTIIGASWGYVSFALGGIAGALGGGLLGALAGVILGLAMGLAAGLTARIFGWR
jgi:hypothetical protein